MADLLTQLHEYAVETAGGRSSVLLQSSPRTRLLHATSAFGLESMSTTPWLASADEARLVRTAFASGAPMLLTNLPSRHPALADHLSARHAVLVPLEGLGARLGLLVLGLDAEPDGEALTSRVTPVADAFVLAIERLRLQRDADLQRQLRALMHEFSRQVASTLSVRAGLDSFCVGAARLFGTDRTSVWLHDRDARELKLEASSDPSGIAASQVPVEDLLHPAARALRVDEAQIFDPPAGENGIPTVAVGLRGRRRALGTIVFDGTRIEPGEETDLLARVEEVGHQLAAAIETTQLLAQVIRREPGPDVR